VLPVTSIVATGIRSKVHASRPAGIVPSVAVIMRTPRLFQRTTAPSSSRILRHEEGRPNALIAAPYVGSRSTRKSPTRISVALTRITRDPDAAAEAVSTAASPTRARHVTLRSGVASPPSA
jgi:hypothetical protein